MKGVVLNGNLDRGGIQITRTQPHSILSAQPITNSIITAQTILNCIPVSQIIASEMPQIPFFAPSALQQLIVDPITTNPVSEWSRKDFLATRITDLAGNSNSILEMHFFDFPNIFQCLANFK